MSANENPQTIKLAVQLFSAQELGRSLKEVAVDIIKNEDKNIESRWYHSNKDADLFIWKDQNQNIIKQQVTFYGQLMEWNIIEGMRTGYVVEDETSKVTGSSLIHYDRAPQRQTAQQGIDIVGYIPGLNNSDKIQIISNFTHSPIFSQLEPEEILKRYGIFKPARTKPEWLCRLLNILGLLPKDK